MMLARSGSYLLAAARRHEGGSARMERRGEEACMTTEAFDEALDQTREIEITSIGRRTGGPITFPVWFVRRGDSVLLLPLRGSDTGWYRNLLQDPTLRVLVGADEHTATATLITDPPGSMRWSRPSGPGTAPTT
jgi:deazaflavin-dependent oxidoreductase (nitroreductase family)